MDLTPKEFELLLVQFCKQDLPPHFKVEHDIKDIGSESNNKRQIDTKISGRLGISDILICGEARNWNEPLGSDSIDGIVGKYFSSEIRANKVILFSNYGFTTPAVTRAKLRGIELLEPKTLGQPIHPIPHIVGMGYLGQMVIQIVGHSPQYTQMSINPDDYTIIKGPHEISFQQNFYRIVVSYLRDIPAKSIFMNLSKIRVEDKNVLYELKHKKGFRYNADFQVDIALMWDYWVEYLPTGILFHINSGETKVVNLQEDDRETLNRVLLSPSKINFEKREDCITEIAGKNIGHLFQLCMVDPDGLKNDPHCPLLSPL
jgi:hypothetical protein